jgi:hypothetical protein
MTEITLNFEGPFTLVEGEKCLFQSVFTTSSGIYLWTIKQDSDNTHLIHYVGETVLLGKRHREHLIQILGLNYGIFDPDKARQGVSDLLWKGLWRDKTNIGPLMQLKTYRTIHEDVLRYISILNVFFAELDIESNLRKHVEGCIGWHLRNIHPEHKVLYPDDNHIGTSKNKGNGILKISVPETIRGLDDSIPY